MGSSSRARAEQSLRFTERYRAYVINYSAGEEHHSRLCRALGRIAPQPGAMGGL